MRLSRWVIALGVVVFVLFLGSCWLFLDLPQTETFNGDGGTITTATSEFTVSIPIAAEVREICGITLNGFVHPNSADLLIRLEAPGGFSLNLSSYRGTGSQSFDGNYTFVDPDTADAVNIYVTDTSGTIIGTSYWSDADLDEFYGKDVRGTWTLSIVNNGSVGSLTSWSLELTYKKY